MSDDPAVRMLKYSIASDASTSIVKGAGAVIQCVGIQQANEICLWAEVPPGERTEARRFIVVATGEPVTVPSIYRGTVFDGPFVWHVREVAGG